MINDRDERVALHKHDETQAEARCIKLKAECAQETLSALQAQAQDGHASVQELEVNAQRRADEAFNAFKLDCHREVLTAIHDGIAFHEQVARDSEAYGHRLSDEVTEYWAEARAAERSEQTVDRELTRARAQSEQRRLDNNSLIAAHRQLTLDAKAQDMALRSEADAALAEQQVSLLAQMASNKEEIMQEVLK